MTESKKTQFPLMATLLVMMMADLNEEDEDDAEPPELHCCKHCAKDVALRTMLFLLGLVMCYESYQGA